MGTTRVEGRCSRTSRTRGRLPLEPFFPYLIIDCAFLGITKDLKGKKKNSINNRSKNINNGRIIFNHCKDWIEIN